MKFTETGLPGAWLIEREPAHDVRGFFARTFCVLEYAAHELEASFVQHSHSHSTARGTVRGLHFQAPPHGEVKVIRCVAGAIWDVVVDLRPQSPTYCQWQGFELSADDGRQLYVPKGFAHGFQTLRPDSAVSYLISEFHEPAAARGLRYDDPALAIDWPLPVTVVADKDLRWPAFTPGG